MAHELDMSNNRANMAFVGETPWHGLGAQIDGKASIDDWRVAAGLDWTIMQSDVWYSPDTEAVPADLNKQVLFRSDTKRALSVVGSDYKIVQPGDVLEFFRSLTEAGGFEMHTAGSLFGGRKLWALAKIGDDAAVAKKDKVGGYLLLTTSCDGTMATTAKFTSVRVVCNNTLSMAVPRSDRAAEGENVKVPHSTQFDASAVHDALGVGHAAFSKFIDEAKRLAKVKLDDTKALWVLREGFADAIDADYAEMDSEKFSKVPTVAKVLDLYQGKQIGYDAIDAVHGTAWGVVNAVTEFYDHHVRAKSIDNRLESAWFGKGNFVKKCVWERALELV